MVIGNSFAREGYHGRTVAEAGGAFWTDICPRHVVRKCVAVYVMNSVSLQCQAVYGVREELRKVLDEKR